MAVCPGPLGQAAAKVKDFCGDGSEERSEGVAMVMTGLDDHHIAAGRPDPPYTTGIFPPTGIFQKLDLGADPGKKIRRLNCTVSSTSNHLETFSLLFMVKKSKGCYGGIMGLVGVAGTRVPPAPTLDPPLARSYYKTYKQRHETVMTRLKMTRKKSHF